MTTRRCAGAGAGDVEEPPLLGEQLAARSSGGSSPSRPIRSACSREPRRRRSGQAPSWTWATTTSRHSRPLARWAVSSRTASPRTPRSARVSAGICWAAGCRGSSRTLVWPALLLGAGGRLEQRAERVEVAVGAAGRAAAAAEVGRARSRVGQAVPDHSTQSTSSAVPPPSSPSRARDQQAASRRRAAPRLAGQAVEERRRRARRARTSSRRGAAAAGLRRARLLAGAQRRARRAGRRRRARRAGEVSSASARSAVDVVAGRCGSSSPSVDHDARARRAAAAPPARGPAGSRRRRPRPARPAAASARRSAGIEARPERTSTAISDQRTPSSRWARRSRSARCSASARAVSKVQHLDPAVAELGRRRLGSTERLRTLGAGSRR